MICKFFASYFEMANIFKAKLFKISISYLIFICFCFAGCLYHIIEVTRVFLQFQTKIDVSLDNNDLFLPPIISFCAQTFYSTKNPSENTYNQSTPSAIYNRTYDVSDVFLLCKVATPNQYLNSFSGCNIINDDQVQIEKTINYHYVCYTIKYSKHNQYLERQQFYDDPNKEIFSFFLYHHPNRLNFGFKLYLTSEYNGPNGFGKNSLKINGKSI